MMGLSSIVLCLSFFLSVLTPYPMALSHLMYGRNKSLALAAGMLFLFVMIISSLYQDYSMVVFYSLCLIVAFALAEVVVRKVNPIKGIVYVGLGFSLVGAALFWSYSQSLGEGTLKQQLVLQFEKMKPELEEQRKKIQAAGSGDTTEVEALLGSPDLLATELLRNAPSFILVSLFVMLWLNMYLLLKTNRLINRGREILFTEKNLLDFKVPEYFIWPVITLLALVLGRDYVGEFYSDIGLTLLKVIGVFYFFQGFGIYLAFLDKMRIVGFLRSLLVVVTLFTASWTLAVVGLADMFVDFKKLMNKKNQGE